MTWFHYRALSTAGTRRTGRIEAADRPGARARLKEQGLCVLDLRPASARPSMLRALVPNRRVSPRTERHVYDLTRQLAMLLRAGVPLASALETLRADMPTERLRHALGEIGQSIREGEAFAETLTRHPALFDPVYCALVRAGEASGTLDETLLRLASYLKRRLALRGQIVSALTYPALVSVVGVFVVTFLVHYVVPKVLGVLVTGGRPLPLPTRLLLAISGILTSYWPVLLVFGIALVVAVGFAARQPSLRRRFDRLQLAIPLYGGLLTKQLVARLCELLASLLSAGITMGEALSLAGQAVGNRALAELLERARDEVVAGRSLAESIGVTSLLPASVYQMLVVGQASGHLDEVLGHLAHDYQGEVDVAAERFTAILEPVLIVCLAVVVGFIVLATLLPILELTSGLDRY